MTTAKARTFIVTPGVATVDDLAALVRKVVDRERALAVLKAARAAKGPDDAEH